MNNNALVSVCLPVYNFDVTELVEDLINQAHVNEIPIEILVFDDHSISYYKKRNQELAKHRDVSYLEFDNNLGRSKIRNRLADFAIGEWLLFLDCDMVPSTSSFLSNYVNAIRTDVKVICGGIAYGDRPIKADLMLRWRYGVLRESRSSSIRQHFPYKSFLSGNFMIAREVYYQIRFNEEISGYGHEDTLFGLDLKKNKVPILHIDNTCLHLGIEPCFEYLVKSEQGIINLVRLLRIVPEMKVELERNIRLLRYYKIVRFMGLSYPMRLFFRFFNPFIRRLLCKAHPSLFLFDLYKVGLIAQIYHNPNLSSRKLKAKS